MMYEFVHQIHDKGIHNPRLAPSCAKLCQNLAGYQWGMKFINITQDRSDRTSKKLKWKWQVQFRNEIRQGRVN